MSSFNLSGGTEEVWSCVDCSWCCTKKHFADGPTCVFCGGDAEKISEIEPSQGMSDFKYRELLDQLREDAAGVGDTTVENIEQHFEEGDDFLDATESAYTEREFSALKAVDGVGDASAKQIALTIGEREGWEDTAILVL